MPNPTTGLTSAPRLVESASNVLHSLTQYRAFPASGTSSALAYSPAVLSAYVQQSTRRYIALRLRADSGGANGATLVFDTQAGAITYQANDGAGATRTVGFEAAGGAWLPSLVPKFTKRARRSSATPARCLLRISATARRAYSRPACSSSPAPRPASTSGPRAYRSTTDSRPPEATHSRSRPPTGSAPRLGRSHRQWSALPDRSRRSSSRRAYLRRRSVRRTRRRYRSPAPSPRCL